MADIDKRIVEMTFENHLFEKNVDTSIHSLEKLKSALNFDGTSRGLNELEQSVNSLKFDKLADNVDSLSKRFSTMGIAGMTVIQNLTNAALNLASTLARPLTGALNQIVSGGWSRATNIDQAKFKLEGLDVAWNDIYEDINYGVDKTAYGLDAAATAAAQLVASGVEFGEKFGATGNSPMAHALKGISGVAAMTSSSYEEISRIFTQVAGNGRLMGDQLLQLSSRGLNAAAILGKKLNKTEEEIRKMASKGEISFEQFSETMFEKFGDHATEANKTFEGSLSNMKSALSRIGQPVAEKFRSTMVGIFNSFRLLFNGIKNAFADSGLFDQVGRAIENFGAIGKGFIDKFYEVKEDGKVVIAPLQELASFVTDIVSRINDFFDPIAENFGKAVDTAKNVTDSAKEVLNLEKHVEEMAWQVIRGDFGNGEERKKALEDRKEYYELIQNKVNELKDNTFRYEISEERINALYRERGPLIEKGGKVLGKYVSYQGELYETTDKSIKQTERNASSFEGLTYAIAGVMSVFDVLKSTLTSLGKGVFEGLQGLFGSIGQAAANAGVRFGEWAINLKNTIEQSDFYTKAQEKAKEAAEAFSKALTYVVDTLKKVWNFLTNVGGKMISIFGQIRENAGKFFDSLKNTEGYKRISSGFKTIKERLIDFKDNAIAAARQALEDFMGMDIKLPEFDLSGFAASVSEKIVWLTDKLKEFKETIKGFFNPGGTEGKSTKVGLIGLLNAYLSDGSLDKNVKGVKLSLADVKESFEETGEQTEVYTGIQGKLRVAALLLSVALKAVVDTLAKVWNFLTNVGGKMVSLFGQLREKVGKFFDSLKNTEGYKRITIGFQTITQKILEFKDNAIASAKKALEEFMGTDIKLPEFDLSSFAESISEKIVWLTDKLKEFKESVKEFFSPSGTEGEGGGGPLARLKEYFSEFSLGDYADNLIANLIGIKDNIVGFFTVLSENTIGTVSDSLTEFFNGETFQNITDAIGNVTSSLKDKVPTFEEAWDLFMNVMKKIRQVKLQFALTGAVDAIISVERIFHWANKTVKWASKTVKAAAKDLRSIANKNNSEALLNVAKAIGILAASFILLSGLDFKSDGFKSAAIAIGLITAALAVLLLIMRGFNKANGAMTPIESISQTLSILRTNLNMFMRKVGTAGIIVAFGVAMTMLTSAFIKLTQVPWQQCLSAAIVMGSLIAALVIAVAALGKISQNSKFSLSMVLTLIAIAGAVSIMAKAMEGLSTIKDYGRAILGLAAVTAALSVLMYFSMATEHAKIGPMLALMGLITILAGTMLILSAIPTKGLVKTVSALTTVLIGLAALVLATSKIQSPKSAIVAIAAVGALLAEIAIILAILPKADADSDAILKSAGAIGIIIAAVSLLMAVISKTGNMSIKQAALGAVNFDIIAGIVMGFIGLVAGLVSLLPEDVYNSVIEGLERIKLFTTKVGEIIGGFFGGIVGGAIEASTASLPQAGTDIANFVENIAPAFNESNGFSMDGLDTIFELIGKLVHVGSENTISDIRAKLFLGDNSLIVLGKDLAVFAALMQVYAENIDGLPSEMLNETSDAIDAVVSYAEKADDIKNAHNLFTGESDIVSLAKDLCTFAPEIKKYAEAIEGLPTDILTDTSNAIDTVMKFANAVPAQHTGDSFWDELLNGDNTLKTLGENLVPFGKAMTEYSIWASHINGSAVEATENACSIVIALAEKMPTISDDDTWKGWIVGDNSFSAISDDLVGFGQALVDYSKTVEPLASNESITSTENLVKIVQGLAKSMPDVHGEGTVMGWLLGDNSLGNFGTNLEEFGSSLVTYNNTLNGVDFKPSIDATRQINALLQSFARINTNKESLDQAGFKLSTVVEWIKGNFTELTNFVNSAEGMTEVTAAGEEVARKVMEAFSTALSGGDSEGSGKSTNFINKLVESFSEITISDDTINNAGQAFVEKLVGSWKTNLGADSTVLDEPIATVLDGTITKIGEYNEKYDTAANDAITEVGDIISLDTTLSSKVGVICQGMVDTARTYVSQFVGIGGDIMNGLAAGITMSSAVVTSAINNAMQSAINTGNTKLQINSPSKVFARMGSGIMEGLALGVNENTNLSTGAISDAVTDMVGTMVRGIDQNEDRVNNKMQEIFSYLASAYSYINNVINDSLNSQPTITPVMDLSQVQNGVGYMNGLFGNGYAFGTGSLAYARNNWASSYQYGAEKSTMNTQAGIISAIRGVRSDINYLGERIANMQMVMDSGAIVGSIGGGMDRQLGNIQKYKERWA